MRLLAPADTTSANVDGAIYTPDENGFVEVQVPAHADTLKSLGFVDPATQKPKVADVAPPAPKTVQGLEDGQTEADRAAPASPGVVLLNVAALYPNLAEGLALGGVEFAPEESATDLLSILDRHFGEAKVFAAAALETIEGGEPVQYEIGEFVSGALEAAGLTDVSDLQAVLDAIEERFEPFAAFDPNGDGKPGGGVETEDSSAGGTGDGAGTEEAAPVVLIDPVSGKALDELKTDEIKAALDHFEIAYAANTAKPILLGVLTDKLAEIAAAAANAPEAGQ